MVTEVTENCDLAHLWLFAYRHIRSVVPLSNNDTTNDCVILLYAYVSSWQPNSKWMSVLWAEIPRNCEPWLVSLVSCNYYYIIVIRVTIIKNKSFFIYM